MVNMVRIAVLSDVHLLMQAEWIEDESQLTVEGREVLENFERAVNQVERDKPNVVILAGDMFDYRTKSRQRVAHREGEKYMLEIRSILEHLVDDTGCQIYALKGNHDSEAVLRSTEKALKGKFIYAGDSTMRIGDLNVFFMNSHYAPGIYEIPLEGIPKSGDLLIAHESAPLWGVPAPTEENFRLLCRRFKFMFNGHMHAFQTEAMGIPNLYMLPAFIPSREIKGNWMLRYKYPDGLEPEARESPFGYMLLEDGKAKFCLYNPLQIIVRAEVRGDNPEDFLAGIREIYEILSKREDKHRLRVWVETNADPITIERALWPAIREYSEIQTIDVIPIKPEPRPVAGPPRVEFGEKAFTREELIERALGSLTGEQGKVAMRIFDEIFTVEYLTSRKIDEPAGFQKLLEIISREYKVSDAFLTRAWELAKRRGGD